MSAVNRISEDGTLGFEGSIVETSKTFSPFSSLLSNILYHPEQHSLLFPMGRTSCGGLSDIGDVSGKMIGAVRPAENQGVVAGGGGYERKGAATSER
jgi:hypothetical protein